MYEEINGLVKKYEDEVAERSKKKNPQYYHALNNLNWSRCLQAALAGQPLPPDAWSKLCGSSQGTSVTSIPCTKLKIELHDGDRIMDILDAHRDIPDIHDQLKRAVDEQGFRVEGFYIRTRK